MQDMKTTITGKNQVTIPSKLAKHLGLRAGFQLEWASGNSANEIVARTIPDKKARLSDARKLGRTVQKSGARMIADLAKERNNDDQLR